MQARTLVCWVLVLLWGLGCCVLWVLGLGVWSFGGGLGFGVWVGGVDSLVDRWMGGREGGFG